MNASNVTGEDELYSLTVNFLLQYRATPHTVTRKSPAELFIGRKIKTTFYFQNTRVSFRKGNLQVPTVGYIMKSLGNHLFIIIDPSDQSIHR